MGANDKWAIAAWIAGAAVTLITTTLSVLSYWRSVKVERRTATRDEIGDLRSKCDECERRSRELQLELAQVHRQCDELRMEVRSLEQQRMELLLRIARIEEDREKLRERVRVLEGK